MADHDLASKHPDVLFTPLNPGEHSGGAIWRLRPRSGGTPIMWARTDEDADRYAETIARIARR
ncbi:hypothetical protein [Nocardiopsis lambiniae]|uniref:Uncharacterized protein n=1 Tax=Nocardiopsis lambiniae TaxID=3075539 RepID=A0ABU2M736_9ACTN|nr:hypothetical protein [Nocardiopsis sp. DSM 44743]MDT0328488.1 hypothetical protein [Nocardiopsis sp. DSM 44743]